ncbi:hypothetical protein F503_01337 [Ophiostoma piceae UAMH 11346]|uniref:Uncharacterized protein n=1 Tax=Ophiostoma piceae (strain UAMH 11346) TaxID=1262450 RepID=S3CDF7_OPHP1|nr:hypothetical protein F503_01337 [Ophiostoma piceae UAMH 11346]
MVTLLSTLTSKNPQLDTSKVPLGPNTVCRRAKEPLGWIPWAEFSYDNLTAIFNEQLMARYDGPSTSRTSTLPLDLEICNEQTFELALHRFIMPTVNHCLAVSSTKPHYGPGSRCTLPDAKPDWSCVGRGVYFNYVPGDTKLSAKFWPSMLDTNFREWQKVIGQVMTYQLKFASRYGFIITDDVLVVMRITSERTGPGIATSRGRRPELVQSVNYNNVDASDANTAASFVDDQPLDWEVNPPQYAILALWCLAMMSVKGGNNIDCSYPALNSWRIEGSRYVHNSSGVTKKRAGRRDVIQGRDPDAAGDWFYAEGEASSSGQNEYGQRERGEEDEEDRDEEDGDDDDGDDDAGDVDGVGGDSGPGTHGGEGDAGPVGSHGGDGSDTETIVPGLRRMHVSIKKHFLTRRPYFIDARGREVDTDVTEWTRVRHHYELSGRRHIYVADTFPE